MFGCYSFVLLYDNLAVRRNNIKIRQFSPQPFGLQAKKYSFFRESKSVKLKKFSQNLVRRKTHCFQQSCYRHFSAPINPKINVVLGVKLKIQPGTTIRNN